MYRNFKSSDSKKMQIQHLFVKKYLKAILQHYQTILHILYNVHLQFRRFLQALGDHCAQNQRTQNNQADIYSLPNWYDVYRWLGIDHGPGWGCHFLSWSNPSWGGQKLAEVMVSNLFAMYDILAYKTNFKVQNPTLKNWGGLVQQI